MYRALTLGNFFRRKGRDKLSLASGINAATHRGLERREAGGAEAGIVAGPDVGAGVESQWCWWGGKGEGKGFIQSKRSE
jgi:hypothetical protein